MGWYLSTGQVPTNHSNWHLSTVQVPIIHMLVHACGDVADYYGGDAIVVLQVDHPIDAFFVTMVVTRFVPTSSTSVHTSRRCQGYGAHNGWLARRLSNSASNDCEHHELFFLLTSGRRDRGAPSELYTPMRSNLGEAHSALLDVVFPHTTTLRFGL